MNRATLVLLASLFAARGHTADITLTATTGTGIVYGVARELVYGLYKNQQYTVSELDWGLQSLYTANAALSMQVAGGIAASLSVQLGIPGKTGSITDSDWLNAAYDGTTNKTNYSRHDCYTERAILLDAQAGWEIPLAGWVTLEPFLAFELMDFKWTARDGFLQYPPGYLAGSGTKPYPDASTDVVVPVSGTVILYRQTYYIPAVGLSAKIHSVSTSGAISFAFSPLVFCNDVDNHELAGNDYYDTMSNGILLEPKISLKWALGRSWLSLDVSYRHIEGLIGNTTRIVTGVGHVPGQVAQSYSKGAGASYDAVNVSLGFNWTP